MGSAVGKLLDHLSHDSAHDLSAADVRGVQIEALNERFDSSVGERGIVRRCADAAGVKSVRRVDDVVPLLLPHTVYKSYPDSYLIAGRWPELTAWLGSVSAHPTADIDLSGVHDLDSWVASCERSGHFISCSSGTTGKPAILGFSQSDIDFAAADGIAAVQWGSDIRAGDRRIVAGPATSVAYTPRNIAKGRALMSAFLDPDVRRPQSPMPPVTMGSIIKASRIRKEIADNAADKAEVAEYEADVAMRQAALAEAQIAAVDYILGKRAERLYITGLWDPLYELARRVRERGYGAADFHPENSLYVSGGLKRAQLPADYREYIYESFNLSPRFICELYGMQEINSSMPRCRAAGRFHVPPWVVVLLLDRNGRALTDGANAGAGEGRAAFFDLSLDGHWGGVISSDQVHINFEPCACGARSPSIDANIRRYPDLSDGENIGDASMIYDFIRMEAAEIAA